MNLQRPQTEEQIREWLAQSQFGVVSFKDWILDHIPSPTQLELSSGSRTESTSTTGMTFHRPRSYGPLDAREDEDLAARLINRLKQHLEERPEARTPVSDRLHQNVRTNIEDALSCTFGAGSHESDVSDFVKSTLSVVRRIIQALQPSAISSVRNETLAVGTGLRVDIVFEVRQKVVWAIEVKRAAVLERHERGFDGPTLTAAFQSPGNLTSAQRIVFKLACWMISKGVEYGMLCDGQSYRIFEQLLGRQVVFSPKIRMNDPDCPFISILLAVALTFDEHKTFRLPAEDTRSQGLGLQRSTVATANERPPARSAKISANARIVSSNKQSKGTTTRASAPKLKILRHASRICLNLCTGEGSYQFIYDSRLLRRRTFAASRIPARAPARDRPASKPVSSKKIIQCTLGDYFAVSRTSHCYRWNGASLVVKIAERRQHDLLQTESRVYETSLAPLAGVAIPAFYGLYTDDILDVIIMADVGIAIKDWADLNQAQKHRLYAILQDVHRCGIEHGDFACRNVTVDANGKVWLIDFSHAAEDHQCKGETCWELALVRSQLGLSP